MKAARKKWSRVRERTCFCRSRAYRLEHEAQCQRREAIARAQELLFDEGTRPDRWDAGLVLQLPAFRRLTLVAANM